MIEILEFRDAIASFRSFLEERGHPSKITWAFREDLWSGVGHLRVRRSSNDANELLVQKVYTQGREKGLVEITALGRTADGVVATVWFPKYSEQEVQGWSEGLKLSIRSPLPPATFVPRRIWRLAQLLPSYRDYQAHEPFVGTKRWAAA